MKPAKKTIVIALIVISLIAMFLPLATFHENTAGAANEEITKQQGKVESAQKQLDRWIAGGKKSESDIEKQRAKVEKEQQALDALIAEQEANASQESGQGISYALLPSQLPSELQIDQTVINQYKVYNTNFPAYYLIRWLAFGFLAVAAVLLVLAGNKTISKLYTFSSFAHLIGFILLAYTILRLAAFPIKTPYTNADLNPLITVLLVACPLVAFALHISSVHNKKMENFLEYNIAAAENEELKQKGFLIIPGRVSRRYFEEKFYGMQDN